MQLFDDKYHRRGVKSRSRIREGLIYLPGAVLLAYGFWLSLTA
jgi:hypothetical protein